MKTTPKMIAACCLALALIFSGCGGGQSAAPTLTPSPTYTPPPPATPVPTATPDPTLTSTTALPPTPAIELPPQLGDLISAPSLTFNDAFDSLSSANWNAGGCQAVTNGELIYACTDSSSFSRKYVFHGGEGILIDLMKVKPAGDFNWGVDLTSGTKTGPDWVSFGINDDANTGTRFSIGKASSTVTYDAISWLKSDTWYRIALAIDQDGRLLVSAWERDNPSALPWNYSNNLGKDWAGKDWMFSVNNNKTIILHLDNFQQFKFGKVK